MAQCLRTLLETGFHTAPLCAGPGGEEVPPVFIDRSGLRASLQEQYTRNSKGTLSLVLEQVPPPTFVLLRHIMLHHIALELKCILA